MWKVSLINVGCKRLHTLSMLTFTAHVYDQTLHVNIRLFFALFVYSLELCIDIFTDISTKFDRKFYFVLFIFYWVSFKNILEIRHFIFIIYLFILYEAHIKFYEIFIYLRFIFYFQLKYATSHGFKRLLVL